MTSKRQICRSASILVLAAFCAGAGLSGCQRAAPGAAAPPPPLAALPPTTGALPPSAPAPAADALPPAPAAPVQQLADPSQGYAFADRAYAMSQAFAGAPPDYTFEDQGERPWVWRANDGAERVAEATPEGERYYYYAPGADQPYYVQDGPYGYGFEGGALVASFGPGGRYLPPDAQREDLAGRYLARSRWLHHAARTDPRAPVGAGNWADRRAQISAQRQAWAQDVNGDPGWRAYHDAHRGEEQAHWRGEAERRDAWAARVDASLGDQARAQAEWRAAGATAAALAAARGASPPPGGQPAWARRPPPPLTPPAQPPGFVRRQFGQGAPGGLPGQAQPLPAPAQQQGPRQGRFQPGFQTRQQAQQRQGAYQAQQQQAARLAQIGAQQQAQQQAQAQQAQLRAQQQAQGLAARNAQMAAGRQAQAAARQAAVQAAQARLAQADAARQAQMAAQARQQQAARAAQMQAQARAQGQAQAQAQAQAAAQRQAAARMAQMRAGQAHAPPAAGRANHRPRGPGANAPP